MLYTLYSLATTPLSPHGIPLYRDKSFPIHQMTLNRSLTRQRLMVGACSEHGLGFQGAGRQNGSARALWNLEVAIEAR